MDNDNNLVPFADNLITVETSNNAKVIAMDNGYPADLNDMNDNQHHVYKGLGLAIIKGLKKGQVLIKATAKELKSSQIKIKIIE